MCWSHRQTGSDSSNPWAGRVRSAGAGPASGLWSGQHCACWDPEARSPSATSCLHGWHLPAELGSRPRFLRGQHRQPTLGSSAAGSVRLRGALWREQLHGRPPGSECFRKQEEHATEVLKAAFGVSWCPGPPAHRAGAGRAVGATGQGPRAATEAWAGSALPDARPRAPSAGKATSPWPSCPQPACVSG